MDSNSNDDHDLINEFYNDLKEKGAIKEDYEHDYDHEYDQEYDDDEFDDHFSNNGNDENEEGSEDEYEQENKDNSDDDYAEVKASDYNKVLQEMNHLLDNTPEFLVNTAQVDENEPTLFSNQYKPKKRKKILTELLEPIAEPQFSVLQNIWAEHKDSIFLNLDKIEKDCIYDSMETKHKTRFSNLPKTAPKGNLPVTFHKKIKSSGYGTKPEALKYSKSKKAQKPKKMFVTRDFYTLPLPMGIPEETKFLWKTPLHTKPITKIQYSNQGTLLASAANDMTISILKWPAFESSMHEASMSGTNISATSFTGHNAAVNSLWFSTRDDYLLSSSSDKSAIVWSVDSKRGKKALVIDDLKQTKASFYYSDKFIAISSANTLNFYKYELFNKSSDDDIKRLQAKGVSKLVQTYENISSHSIISFSVHNNLKSHLGILGWSNKELIVYDVNYNKELAVFDDMHEKVIHTLDFFSLKNEDPNSYNLFYTVSTDNFIRLWDLRTCQPVREFNDHSNRGSSIGWGISNWLRYLISGSEDRAVYIYDLVGSKLLHKTKNILHSDTVSDISISPGYYEWATASLDGHVRVFRHPSKNKKPVTSNQKPSFPQVLQGKVASKTVKQRTKMSEYA